MQACKSNVLVARWGFGNNSVTVSDLCPKNWSERGDLTPDSRSPSEMSRLIKYSIQSFSLGCARQFGNYFGFFFGLRDTWKERQPRRAALIAAMSIFFMPIIASNAQSFPHSQDNVHNYA